VSEHPTTTGMPGLLLAELHGTAYVQVTGVFAVRGEQVAYYGDPAAWEQSPAALEVARLQRIAQLEAELARLQAVEPPPELAPPTAAKRRRRVAAATAVAALPPADPGPFVCEQCGKPFAKAHGLSVHQAIAHKAMATPPVLPAEPEPAEEAAGPKAEARS
jgi:hypothetical protein